MNILLNYVPSAGHLERLRGHAPKAGFTLARNLEEARAGMVEAEVVLGNRYFLQALPSATRLRWMQSNSMGVDLILRGAGRRLDGVELTCARGLYADEVADHALALLLGVSRGLRESVEAYAERRWPRWPLLTLAGLHALVLGWGALGKAIGRRLHGFGVRVSGVRRTGPTTEADGVIVHGPETWRAELPKVDLLIIALPLTPATERCVGAAELASLPRDAVVVNVGRGAVLDQAALFGELRSGRLFGAGVDTLIEEPPLAGDPVWEVPRLLVTPHVGRSLEVGVAKWEGLFEENLRRWVVGEPLLNVVDPVAGY